MPRRSRSPRRRPAPGPRLNAVAAACAVVAMVAAGGCTGQRSSLDADVTASPTVSLPGGAAGTPTGQADADAVLALLEGPLPAAVTVTYSIDRKLGAVTAAATVAHGPLATSVTVRDLRFLLDDAAPRTCDLHAGTCRSGIVDARLSDLGIGTRFWRDSPARALRVAVARRAAPVTGSTVTIAGVSARCVDVAVGTGVEHYCALPAGLVARWNTAYVDVEATATKDAVDQEAFAVPA